MSHHPWYLSLSLSGCLLLASLPMQAEEGKNAESTESSTAVETKDDSATDTADHLEAAEQRRQQWRERLHRAREAREGRRGEGAGRRGEGRAEGTRGQGRGGERLTEEERAERMANRAAERFAMLDTDDSGTVSLQEKLAAPHPRADSDNPPTEEGLQRWQEMRAEIVPIIFALLDADDDGKLTLEEYLANPQAPMHARAIQRFHAADTEGDGVLSREEWEAAMAQRGASRERAGREREGQAREGEAARPRRGPDPAVMFNRFDRNDDGVIDQQEFIEAMEAMRRHRGRRGQRGRRAPQESEG